MNEEKLIKYLLQESDVEESKAVQEWIESDAENKKQFEEIKWVWNSGKLLLEKSNVDENEAWHKFIKVRDGNTAKNVNGGQIAGISNLADSVDGFQVAGIANISKSVNGLEVAGIANISPKIDGVQVAGISSVAKKVDGLQISGIANVADQVEGIQISGLVNRAKTVKGMQIGLINIADSSDLTIGLINIVKDGDRRLGLSIDENLNSFLTFRSGGKRLYGIFGVGTNFDMKDLPYGFEAGLGLNLIESRLFRLDVEGVSKYLTDFEDSDFSKFSFQLLPALKISERMHVFAGPSLSYIHSEDLDKVEHSGLVIWDEMGRSKYQSVVLGFTAGVNVRF